MEYPELYTQDYLLTIIRSIHNPGMGLYDTMKILYKGIEETQSIDENAEHGG